MHVLAVCDSLLAYDEFQMQIIRHVDYKFRSHAIVIQIRVVVKNRHRYFVKKADSRTNVSLARQLIFEKFEKNECDAAL